MNAIQFIKDHGVEKAREVVDSIPAPQVSFYVLDTNTFLEFPDHLDPYPYLNANYKVYVSVSDLKRLVESVDLIKFYGGVEKAKLLLAMGTCLADRPPHAREVQLKQAIADYEAIYSNDIKIEVSFGVSLMPPERVACVDLMPRPAFDLETLRDCETSPNCKKFDEQVK